MSAKSNTSRREPGDERTAAELLDELARINSDFVSLQRAFARKNVELQQSNARFKSLFEGADIGIGLVDLDGTAVMVNPTLEAMLGRSEQELAGAPIADMLCGDGDGASTLKALAEGSDTCRRQRRFVRPDGGELALDITVRIVRDGGGAPHHAVIMALDVTARRRAEDALQELSVVDELTGVYNRRGFFAFAQRQLGTAERLKAGVAVLFGDMDGLKRINDRLGHAEGDRALREVAGLIRRTLRSTDTVGRLGGDEFAVFLIESGEGGVERFVERLKAALEESAEQPRPYHLRLSIGVVRSAPGEHADLERMLQRADALMYEAKREGKREGVLNVAMDL